MLKSEVLFIDGCFEFITFSSDEELLIALESSKSKILNIYVKGKSRL